MKRNVYLDNAATTPMAPEVVDAMIPFLKDYFGNPSSSHSFGRKTKTAIENTRRAIAMHLKVTPGEIIFTSGGTEADNLAIRASVDDLGVNHIITSAIEHSAVIKTSDILEEKHGIKVSLVKLRKDGHVDLQHLEELLQGEGKKLVSLMHGNNEIGNLLPLQTVGELCRKYEALFHSDTVQTMGHYRFNLEKLPIDFITCAGHKFHGPKGCGFLYVNKELRVKAMISGGGQERQLRGGTENTYGIVGLGKAIELAFTDLEEHESHIRALKRYMIQELQSSLPRVVFNGDSKSDASLYTVLNVTFPPNPNSSMMLFLLDLEGVACSGGSACSSGAAKGSHVLVAIDALKQGAASLRFSFSRYTTMEDVEYALSKIRTLCTVPEEVDK